MALQKNGNPIHFRERVRAIFCLDGINSCDFVDRYAPEQKQTVHAITRKDANGNPLLLTVLDQWVLYSLKFANLVMNLAYSTGGKLCTSVLFSA